MNGPIQRRPWTELFKRWLQTFAILALWHLMLSVFAGVSVLQLDWLPPLARVSLLTEEWGWLLAVSLTISVCPTRPLRLGLSAAVGLLIVASWSAFEATGRFASRETLAFFLAVPKQSVEHAAQLTEGGYRSFLFLAAGGVAAAIGSYFMQRFLWGWPRRGVALALLGVAILGWGISEGHEFSNSTLPIDDITTGISYQPGVILEEMRRYHSGPMTTLLRSMKGRDDDAATAYQRSPFVIVTHPVRTPMVTANAPTHRWNVLVIVVESMRRDVLFGESGLVVMPNATAIASEGVRFTDSYTTATQTNLAAPVPLTGQYPLRRRSMGPYSSRIAWPRLLLHDVLKPLGWRTGIFSSQNEEWWGMNRLLTTPALDTLFHAESYAGQTYVPKGDVGFSRFVRRAKKSGKIDDYDTATEAIAWLDHDRGTPFMLALNFQDSHLPYATPKGAPRRVGTASPSFPILFGRFPEESAQVVHAEYLNALAYVDDQIGRIRGALVADGRWDSTIVVLTGDHGQAFFEHDVAAHANGLWQEQVQVPLIIRVPERPASNDSQAASLLDVAPTIVDALGLPPESAWQGLSLLRSQPNASRARFFMVQTPLAHAFGVVVGSWKLIEDVERNTIQLFDVQHDPKERHNLATDNKEFADHLKGILETWRFEQLSYYDSPAMQAQFFAPSILLDSLPLPGPIRPR